MNSINYFFEEIKEFKHAIPPKKWIKRCLVSEEKEPGVINFIFCSDTYLQSINKKYLNKSYFTDVIAFNNTPPNFIKSHDKHIVFGEVFISIERIRENQKLYKTTFSQELKRVMIHGVLHLLGYSDQSFEEKKNMSKIEENILKEISWEALFEK